MDEKDKCIMCSECEYFRNGEGLNDYCVNEVWFKKNHKGEWFRIVDRKYGSCKYGLKKEA